MEVVGGVSGDAYCKDGTSYTSAELCAAALNQSGERIPVPAELRPVRVTTGDDARGVPEPDRALSRRGPGEAIPGPSSTGAALRRRVRRPRRLGGG